MSHLIFYISPTIEWITITCHLSYRMIEIRIINPDLGEPPLNSFLGSQWNKVTIAPIYHSSSLGNGVRAVTEILPHCPFKNRGMEIDLFSCETVTAALWKQRILTVDGKHVLLFSVLGHFRKYGIKNEVGHFLEIPDYIPWLNKRINKCSTLAALIKLNIRGSWEP